MEKEFLGNDKVISIKLQNLWRDFDNIAMKDNENIKMFSSKVAEIINQIKSCGDKIEEKKIVEKVLRSLPVKFEHIVAAIEESKDLSKLTFYELMRSLEAHEKWFSRFTKQHLEQAFQSKLNLLEKKTSAENKRQQQKNQFQKFQAQRGASNSNRGHGRGRGRFQGLGRGNSKTDAYCHICKRNNHETKDCWFRKCSRCKNKNHLDRDCWFRKKEEANFTENEESSEQLFYSCMNVEEESHDIWYLDSGCSNQMTRNRDAFVHWMKNKNHK